MDLIRESLGITIVFALLWAVLWLLKKKGAVRVGMLVNRPGGGKCIEVIDKLRLTPQHSVHVVRVADREIVLGLHASGFTILGERVAARDNTGSKACAT